tara:strand:+ start:5069 stop:5485 length:417 start_codon:yes stop_codon:yes gene_type:complete
MASPSKIIAILFPIFLEVTWPNLCEPSLSNENATIGWLFKLSNLGWASIKFSPLKIILLLTVISSCVDLTKNFSVPNSFSSFVTNLKFNSAVFPRSSFILSGSFTPGNSTNIRLLPLLRIVGSLVPTSSIRLLTISID